MGVAAVGFDQRGHGESEGRLDGRIVEDVATIAGLLPAGPLAMRGSSMGGYVALLAAARLGAAAVVAICPAGSEPALRGHLRAAGIGFDVREPADGLRRPTLSPTRTRPRSAAAAADARRGRRAVPVEHSAELYRAARMPQKRLLELPGGHHRSVQHDAELQGESLRFILKAFAGARGGGS